MERRKKTKDICSKRKQNPISTATTFYTPFHNFLQQLGSITALLVTKKETGSSLSKTATMKRPPQSISLQQHTSSKRIITDLEIRIGETTKRLERALSADKVHNVVVESKSKSLQVLFRTLLSCSALLSWMYFGFLRPMEHEAVQMVSIYVSVF
jgi:hypothetical protein